MNAFVLKYRLPNTDTHRFGPEVPLRDAQRALRLVRFHAAEWGVQTNRIGALGFSAGGHLASTLATHFDAGNTGATDPVERVSCHPDFLMLGYPVISMKAGLTHAGSRNELLNKDPSPELVERFSSELHVTASTPPMFIFCATDDNGVKVDNWLGFLQRGASGRRCHGIAHLRKRRARLRHESQQSRGRKLAAAL